jgi:toxin HigB-1
MFFVIQSFGDRATEDVFHGKDTKAARTFPKALWPVIHRKLDLVNAAHDVRDLRIPPGNQLHAVKGRQKGRYAIRVNDQYRITSAFDHGNASAVRCEDYH